MRIAILFISLLFVFSSCGLGDSKKEAEKLSDKFHKELEAENSKAIIGMLHEEALAADPEARWIQLFEDIYAGGELKKVEQDLGFNSSVNNGIHTITLNYILEFDQGKLREQIVWRTDKDGNLKILSLDYKQI